MRNTKVRRNSLGDGCVFLPKIMTEAGGFSSVESRDYVREVELDLPCKPYKPQGEISSSRSAVARLCGASGRTPPTKR